MIRLRWTAWAFVLCAMAAAVPRSVIAADDAKTVAQQVLDRGASLFDTRDAQAMANTYAKDATIEILSKDNDTGSYKSEVTRGHDAIVDGYAKIFADRSPSAKSKNVVDCAHYIGDDVLVIHGTFTPTVGEDLTVPFLQVRTKQGDAWKMLRLQLFLVK
jgi:hypothetical protein